MRIIEGKDGADLIPPKLYIPRFEMGGAAYEMWKMGKLMMESARLLSEAFQPLTDALDKCTKALIELPIPDEKAEARKRSRADMNRKRKDLFGRRNKRF